MVIWQQFWASFGFKPITWGKKEEEQFMSSASPINKQIPSAIQPNIPTSPGITTQPTSWIKKPINTPLRQPMMTYDVRGTILPWVEDDKAQKIMDYVKSTAKSKEEEKYMLVDLHQQAVKRTQIEKYRTDREKNKAEMVKLSMETKDPEEKNQLDLSLRLSNMSDIVRDGLSKQWIDAWDLDDKEVMKRFMTNNTDKQEVVTNYLNNKIQTVDVAKQLWVIEEESKPEEDKSSFGWNNIEWAKQDNQEFMQWVKNVVGWAYDSATWLPKFLAQNLAKGTAWIAKELWADETKVEQLLNDYMQITEDLSGQWMWADKESLAYKWTKLVWDLAQIANPAWLGKLWVKAGQVAGKVAKEWSLLSNVAKWATIWAVDTAVMVPQSEQRLATPWEIAMWATLWWAMPVIWAGYKKAKEKIWEFGQQLYAKTIKLNPSQIKKIAKDNIAWVDPERWLMDRWIKWSLDDIQKQLDNIAESSYKEINTSTSNVVWRYKSESTEKILSALKKKVEWVEGLEAINTQIDDLMSKGKKWFQVKELIDVKRLLDKRIKLYSSSGDPIAQETVEWLRNLRTDLWKDIDFIAEKAKLPDLRKLSKEIQVSTEISNALDNTINREARNRAMSLTDLIAWWTVWASVYWASGDPVKTMWSIAWLLITKKVLENPALRTKIALKLDKLAPKIQSEIKEAIISKWVVSEPTKKILNDMLVQLWVKTLSSNDQ